jgi:hypothetical protein
VGERLPERPSSPAARLIIINHVNFTDDSTDAARARTVPAPSRPRPLSRRCRPANERKFDSLSHASQPRLPANLPGGFAISRPATRACKLMGYRAYLVAERESAREREGGEGWRGRGDRCNSIRVFPEKDDPAIADRDTLFNRVSNDSLTAYRISIALSRIFIARLLARGTFSVSLALSPSLPFPSYFSFASSVAQFCPRRIRGEGASLPFAGRKRAGKRELSYASERVEMMENNGDTALMSWPCL